MIRNLSILCIILGFFSYTVLAQNSSDSLFSILGSGQTNKYSTDIYRLSTNLPAAILKAKFHKISSILQTAYLGNDTLAIAYLSELTARYHYQHAEYLKSKIYYQNALRTFRQLNDQVNITRCLVMLGNIASDQGNISQSMAYCDSALFIADNLKNQRFLSRIYNNIGVLNFRSKQYEKALNAYFLSLKTKLLLGDDEGIANTYNNIGETYYRLQNNKDAESFFDKALNIRRSIKDMPGIAETLNNLGKLYERNSDFKLAEKAYLESLLISSKLGLNIGMAYNYNSLGKLYIKTNKLDSAKNYLQKGINISKHQQLKEISVSLYNQLSLLAEKQGNIKDALMYMRLSVQYKDSIRSGDWKPLEISGKHNNITTHDSSIQTNLMRENKILKWSVVVMAIIILVVIIILLWCLIRLKNGFNHRLNEIKEKASQLQYERSNFQQKLVEEVNIRTIELQEEINERQKVDMELKKALKRAEDAIYLKNAFLSNMSHEIRTPLNGIIGFASLLENELLDAKNTELYEFANGITQSGERLLHLLTNLIDISRLEANDLEIKLQNANIQKSLESVYQLFLFKANEKGVKLILQTHSENFIAEADTENLPRIITNILDNALKYTESGSIHLNYGLDPERNQVFIKIKDSGIGIDANYLPHIFEPFRQESLGFSRAFQGAGLGLPLAKRLLKLMKGDIEISSQKGTGTIVTIFLKRGLEKKTEFISDNDIIISSLLEFNANPINIMIVEDDRMNRIVLQKMLKNAANIEMGIDGDESLQIISKAYKAGKIFDIMLFDINLPVPWDGISLMKKVKEQYKEYRNIPFIAQTAYAMSGDRERLLEAGFDDYIPKPISKNQLFSTINKHSNKKANNEPER